MKRFLSMMLILLLSFSLVACGGNNNNATGSTGTTDDVVEIVEDPDLVGNAVISVQAEEEWVPYYEAAIARVNEVYPDATINIIKTSSFDHLDVIDSTSVTNPDVADVFALPADRIYGLNQNDVLAPINGLGIAAKVGGYDDFNAGLGGMFNINGEYLAFPMNIETLIVFGNEANANAKGLDLTDTVEFTDYLGEEILIPVFNAWFGVAVTNTAEIEFLGERFIEEEDEDGEKVIVRELYSDLVADFSALSADQQAVFEMLFDYWQTHNAARTSLWDSSAAWGYMDDSFSTGGNTALRIEGPWSTGSLSNLAGDGEDLVILPINQITVHGNPLAHWKGGWGIGVNARIEDNEAQMALAEALIAEIMNTDYAVEFFEASGKIMENVDASVYATSSLSNADIQVILAVLESYEQAPSRPLFQEWGQVWSTWETAILSWDAVRPSNVQEAYDQVQASFRAMMSNF